MGTHSRFTSLLLAALLALFVVSCDRDEDDAGGNGGGNPGANEVWMQNNAFTPGNRTVSPGTIVTWTNRDGGPHTVTGTGFDSGNIGAGGTYSRTFNTAGSYPYHCTIHSGMAGTITVQ